MNQQEIQRIARSGNPIELLNAMLLGQFGINATENPDKKEITTTTVEDETTQTIKIPVGMSKLAASKELQKQYEEEETEINMILELKEWEARDGLHAIMIAIEETFGWINAQHTMFSSPAEIQIVTNIENGVRTTKDAFLGKFKAASWDDAKADVGMTRDRSGREGFAYIVFDVKKKHKERVKAFFTRCREVLRDQSIYKGKSVMVTNSGFEFVENNGSKNIILNPDEERIISNLVIKPLGAKGKRTILFTGKYGTGKTETAMRVGREATAKGITFFYLKDTTQFSATLEKAKQYSPSMVFMEDIDEIGAGENRDSKMNDLLNTLDGVQTKGADLTVIFTTNHENRINKALRRPGRIDLIVKFKEAEPETTAKIYTALLGKVDGFKKLDLTKLVAATPHVQGAVIAEIAKRSIDISRGSKITDEIVLTAIDSMKHQIDFMEADPENKESNYEKLGRLFEEAAGRGMVRYYNDEFQSNS